MTGFGFSRTLVAGVLALSMSPMAFADATSHTPSAFQTGNYVDIVGRDFCKDQNSEHECIDVKIKNHSRSGADLRMDKLPTGSTNGSGALNALQVFELPGCVSPDELPNNVRSHIKADERFTRRTKEQKFHYWKPRHDKTIRVLRSCSYAVAVRRHNGQQNWHFTYVPHSAKKGCALTYKYITKKTDLHKYEKYATFGLEAGGSFAVGSGFLAGAAVAGESAVGAGVGLAGGVAIIAATVAYESGLWSFVGVKEIEHAVDGTRDFVLSEEC